MATDPAPFGFARLSAFGAAKRDIQERYAKLWQQQSADMQAELDDLDKRYWAGEAIDGKA